MVAFFNECDFFENKTRKVKQVNICKRILFDFISYMFASCSSVKKVVTKAN